MDRRACWIVAAAALASSCALEPVSRHVPLAEEDAWPRAQTAFVGDSLRVEVTHAEALSAASAMYAWLIAHDGSVVRAGVVSPGAPTFFDGRTLGVDWTRVHTVKLTEESAAATPAAPSTATLFVGEPGESLAPEHEGSLTGLSASAHIADDTLTITSNLPVMGPRMYFGVWLLGATAADGGVDATLAGRVYGRGSVTFASLASPALRKHVVVTVEYESGPDTPALSSVVLRGAIPTTAVGAGSSGAAAAPAEAPGHVH